MTMADSKFVDKIQESFLSCSICFQPFIRPKALPCLHTFCEGCLWDYVASRFEGTGQFPCPLCRQTVYLPPGGVEALPDNHFIVGLEDAVSAYDSHAPNIQHSSMKEDERKPLLPSTQVNHYSPVSSNNLVRRFGNYGTRSHELIQGTGIAVSKVTDDVFISDSFQNKILCYSTSGIFRNSFACDCLIRDIAVTKGGTILVAVSQAGNAILREYTTEGRLLASHGSFYSQENPYGVTLTRKNLAVVTGLRQNCIHVFTQHRKLSQRFGTRGRGRNHFISPYHGTMTTNDDIVVADSGNHRIKIHKLNGELLTEFGKHGTKPGQLFYPMGVCVDKYDNIYVADANNYRVQAFSKTGECLGMPVRNTYEYGMDVKPVNVEFSSDNVLLVILRGSKFCQVHAYMWNIEAYKPVLKSTWKELFFCCN
ncbi:zinc ion binding [Mactra antiquata]